MCLKVEVTGFPGSLGVGCEGGREAHVSGVRGTSSRKDGASVTATKRLPEERVQAGTDRSCALAELRSRRCREGAKGAAGHTHVALSEEDVAGNDQLQSHPGQDSICLDWSFYRPHTEGLLVPILEMRTGRLGDVKSPDP